MDGPTRLIATVGDESYEVDLIDGTASVAGSKTPLAYERAGPDAVTVIRGDRRHTALVAAEGDRLWVFVAGDAFEIDVTAVNARRRRAVRHHHESLSAPMPATVVKIATAPGTAVSRGEVVLILEAMKMELPVRAPHDGVVEAVHCREGDLVRPGVPLIDLDESHAD